MLFFIRIIIGFIVNSLISPEERSFSSPKFNPLKIMVLSVLLINLFISIHLIRRNAELYEFLEYSYPGAIKEFKIFVTNKEERKEKEIVIVVKPE